MTAPFVYSIGRDRYDVRPQSRQAATLREFTADLLSYRAPSKLQAHYVAAGFGNDGHRRAVNVQSRAWLALDVDGIDPAVHVEWRLFASRWRGFGWPTASSTPAAPRERVIIEMGEPVDRADGMRIGQLLAQDVDAEFGAAVRIDTCTFRGEQPCFLPVGDAAPFFLLGDPLDVDLWLSQAPPPPPAPPPASEIEALQADARMRYVVDAMGRAGLLRQPLANARGYALRCPWEHLHTTLDTGNSTASCLLFPSDGNGWRGGFRCLHSHCEGRGLRDLVALLATANEMEVA